jgi:hypothetical protein
LTLRHCAGRWDLADLTLRPPCRTHIRLKEGLGLTVLNCQEEKMGNDVNTVLAEFDGICAGGDFKIGRALWIELELTNDRLDERERGF